MEILEDPFAALDMLVNSMLRRRRSVFLVKIDVKACVEILIILIILSDVSIGV